MKTTSQLIVEFMALPESVRDTLIAVDRYARSEVGKVAPAVAVDRPTSAPPPVAENVRQRRHWTPEEDNLLLSLLAANGNEWDITKAREWAKSLDRTPQSLYVRLRNVHKVI